MIKQILIYFHFQLAISAVLIYFVFLLIFKITISTECLIAHLIFVGFGTLLGYTFIDWLGAVYATQRDSKQRWLLENKHYVAYIMAVCIVLGGFCMLFFTWHEFILIALLFVITLIYDRGYKNFGGLRMIPFCKPFVIATVWTGATCILAQSECSFTNQSFYFFIWMLIICIVYDEKDFEIDSLTGVVTFTTYLSESSYKYSLYTVFFLFSIVLFFNDNTTLALCYVIACSVLFGYKLFFQRYVFNRWHARSIDFIMVLPFLFFLLFSYNF